MSPARRRKRPRCRRREVGEIGSLRGRESNHYWWGAQRYWKHLESLRIKKQPLGTAKKQQGHRPESQERMPPQPERVWKLPHAQSLLKATKPG